MSALREVAVLLGGLALFSGVVVLLIRAVSAAPWAWLPILLSPLAAVLLLLPLWRRRRPFGRRGSRAPHANGPAARAR
jgi:hypothetical protein